MDDPLSARNVVLSGVALFAVGVAQPLLDLLGQNVAFFVAHDASPLDIAVFAVATTLVAPAVLAAVVLLAVALHRRAGAAVHAAVTSAVVAVAVLAAFRVTDTNGVVPGWLTVGVALAVGVAATALYWRRAKLRFLLRMAALAAPAAAAMFLFATPANRILDSAPTPTNAISVADDAPPIVMIVFDEFPVASLLDARGDVDARAFPSFARFVQDATFFNNATTVHARTVDAIPAIVSGRRSPRDALPTVADHPTSMLKLLSEDYRLHVVEPVTRLCPREKCDPRQGTAAHSKDVKALLRDLSVVEAHLVVPVDWAGSLPPLDEGWRDFAGGEARGEEHGDPTTRRGFFTGGRRDRWAGVFRRFVGDINGSTEPTLHFLHVALPHYPWIYLPDGRQYQPAPTGKSGLEGVAGIRKNRWGGSQWQVLQGYQRHLLQVQFVDRLMGELLDKLESEGLYERSLIVVVADHGASFRPGKSLRGLTRDNLGEIAAVPLFVKKPVPSDGGTSEAPVETVDILPTVLDVLDVHSPGDLDGISVFDKAIMRRQKKRVSELIFDTDIVFDPYHGQTRAAVARKLVWFGINGRFDPFRLAPDGTEQLLGTPAPATAVAATSGTVSIEDAAAYDRVDPDAPTVPALLSGTFAGEGVTQPPTLAIAVNGTIEAVTLADPAEPDGSYPFRALLPPQALRAGKNDIDVLLVEPGGDLLAVSGG